MILITGGLGFIGSHTTRALLDLGERCVVTQHHATEVPDFLRPHRGARLIVEPLDVEDAAGLRRIGERHQITGIVHLADPAVYRVWRRPGDVSPPQLDGLFDGLGHVLEAAADWGAARVTIASTIGVYSGIPPGRWTEDTPLPLAAAHAIPAVKKCGELLAGFVGGQLGLEVVSVRPAAIWGPRGRPSSAFFALPALVRAALSGQPAAATSAQPVHADDGIDACYVKDCGRAIALIQTAQKLNHATYNIGSGQITTNAEMVAAIRARIPEFDLELADGRSQAATPFESILDLTRIREDTGYEPAYDIESGVADYIDWLRAGYDR